MREPPQSMIKIAQTKTKVKSIPRLVLTYLQIISDAHGYFELDAAAIAQRLGVSRRTVYHALATLERWGLVSRVQLRTGRGRHSLYQLKVAQKSRPHEIDEKTVNKKCANSKIRNIYKTQSKDDQGRQGGGQARERQGSERYQGLEAAKVTLIMGARFYRRALEQTRLGLEGWDLPEQIRHAIEGFIGNRIDGASLAYARVLVAKIWALKCEIEALARSGGSPRRVCSFVAGRLAGVPDRAKREVLRRTAELIRSSPDLLTRRITGLKRFEAERETEYLSGHVCKRCGYRHSEIEYRSGYRADGTGQLSCFGWARVKIDELHEHAKLAARRQREEHCRHCGGPLTGGHVDGLCWACWENFQFTPSLQSARKVLCKV